MGAGKTTLIKSICSVLGSSDPALSPTFSLINEYYSKTAVKIYHFDFYRINKITEALDIGCEEYFASGNYCLIEWPEVIAELLPRDLVNIHIEVRDGERSITMT